MIKYNILIVEDSDLNRSILRKILSVEYDIIEAQDGIEALEIIEKRYPEISAVILDLIMPRMGGMELLKILSGTEKYNQLPIMIATGEHDDKLESACLKSGAWDFVTKPYNPVVLKSRLHNIIGLSQTQLMYQIRIMAERDSLTNLYNRRFFMKMTSQMLHKNKDRKYVLIRMDIDQFRLYNSSFGSRSGDVLLMKIANEINIHMKHMENVTYGRVESDVFCLCVPYEQETIEENLKMAKDTAQKLCDNYHLRFSFGLYVIENADMDMEKIYANAVEAARVCKKDKNISYAYYNEDMGYQEIKAQMYSNEMNRAIEERQFQVYLQPKYSILTETPCGAEALVRWIHPKWGTVSPGEFIPIFEQNGLVVRLDYYMWESVCMLLQKWQREGRKLYPVSVNMSRISMYHPKIVEELVELTKRYEIPTHYLNLEITESAYMTNPDMMKRIIEGLRQEGFVILMDDFGSGYSSLNTLKDIDVDILKIDMKFLPTGHDNSKSEKILVSVIRMAGWIGMPIIVEGVETQEQKEFLERIGCNYVQGYYYAKPMQVPEYEQLMEEKAM